MVTIKEMPFSEKYANVVDAIKLEESVVPAFAEKHLDAQAVAKLQWFWHDGFERIPDYAHYKDKYEAAYGNWIRMGQTSFNYIRDRLGNDGVELLKLADVEALKRKNASPSLLLLKLLRIFVPGYVFSIISKQLSYQLQWISPFLVTELSSERLVLNMPKCQIKNYPNTEDLCNIGCQSIYPMWLAEQFKVEMKANRKWNSCTLTFSPLG
jgi:hypothetical protein